MSINTGGTAFPLSAVFNEGMGIHSEEYGMTLRDYFAAKAMQAIIAKTPFDINDHRKEKFDATAKGAYEYADAMLMAREVCNEN